MRRDAFHVCSCCLLLSLSGCNAASHALVGQQAPGGDAARAAASAEVERAGQGTRVAAGEIDEAAGKTKTAAGERRAAAAGEMSDLPRGLAGEAGIAESAGTAATAAQANAAPAGQAAPSPLAGSTPDEPLLALRLDKVAPVTAIADEDDWSGSPLTPAKVVVPRLPAAGDEPLGPVPADAALPADAVQLNLPTALSLVGGQHPAVGLARWRVQEAYARLTRARALWLPSIQPGFGFHRHDGNYQASNSNIVDVNRNSFQFGLAAGAAGAGTTPIPGIAAQFHLADAIFQPKITRTTAWARGHAANAVVNAQLRDVAVAYLQLLFAVQELRIVEETRRLTSAVAKLTRDFAAAGRGLEADADRLDTELRLVEDRLASAREAAAVGSSRLAQALSIEPGQRIAPLDPTVVPIELVSLEMDEGTLIRTGLTRRPELKEAQALVAAACEQYRRQRYAPFVPSVLLGFSTGGFGSGAGSSLSNVDDRYDFDAVVTWQVRNLGIGEAAARRETAAQFQQAKFEKLRVMDQVAGEIQRAHAQAVHRADRIPITERAIQSAEDSYRRNLERIRDGEGLPLEALQSLRALEDARRAYLTAVIAYNEAQFRLQWALGWTVFAGQPD